MFEYKAAGGLAFVTALLHVAGLALGGWPGDAGALIAGAVIWLALGAGLRRNLRFVAYVAFVFAIFGAIFALGAAMGALSGTLQALWWSVAAVDGLVMVSLFGALWAARETSDVT